MAELVEVIALQPFDTNEWGVRGPFVQGQTYYLPEGLVQRLEGPGFFYVQRVQPAAAKKRRTKKKADK